MRILAIDPGPEKSGWCVIENGVLIYSGVFENLSVLKLCQFNSVRGMVAIEKIESYGMPVGAEVFETCIWVGRFIEKCMPFKPILIGRKDVKLNLCNSISAKDSNVRQALLDRFDRSGSGKTPQIGTKKNPGPLYGVSSHAWAALAVAITVADKLEKSNVDGR